MLMMLREDVVGVVGTKGRGEPNTDVRADVYDVGWCHPYHLGWHHLRLLLLLLLLW